MPRNARPGGLFGDWQYGWENTTLNERIQAQNTWDLLEAQEKANMLSEEKLIKQQEYNDNLILSLKELSDNNALQLAAQQLKHENEIKNLQEQQKVNRLCSLCEKYNINYEELKTFLDNLQIQDNYIPEDHIFSKNQIEREIQTLNSKLENMQFNFNRETDIQDKELNILNIKQSFIFLTATNIVISLLVGTALIGSLMHGPKVTLSILAGYIIYELIRYIFIKTMRLNKICKLETEIKQLRKIKQKELNKFNSYKNKCRKQTNNSISELNKRLKEINNIIENDKKLYADKLYNRIKNFDIFRKTHYNEDIEFIISLFKVSLPKIQEEDIQEEGSIQDYIKYIRKVNREV